MKSSHSNLRAHRVFAAIAAIFTTCAHAILDTNSNGLSDLWEKQYNQGNLFPNTFLPTSDPDLDGWNNMTESIAGTNPLDANQPSGILQPHIQATSATGFFQIDHPTVLGKNYQLQGSADLVSWLDINDAVLARQEQLSSVSAVATNTGGLPAHFFWRVLIRDNDSDDDGLTDSEETTLQTNPYYSDTDNDGIADKNEILRSLDPLNPDTDSDTLYDGRVPPQKECPI